MNGFDVCLMILGTNIWSHQGHSVLIGPVLHRTEVPKRDHLEHQMERLSDPWRPKKKARPPIIYYVP
jgi:hypothetical protein